MNFTEAGNSLVKGNVAQQIWWYSAFTAALTKPGTPLMYDDGTPRWRMAPSPKGAYWEEGMKLGYQDAGSWTFLKSTPVQRMKAAWLYAQFVVSKTVSLKKTLVGLTPIRSSDIYSKAFTERAPFLGGLVEFYQSRGPQVWTPTGTNVPDYTLLSNYWWQYVGRAVEQGEDVATAMRSMARAFDLSLAKLGQKEGACSPKLIAPIEEREWLERSGAPKPALVEFPAAETLPYKEAIRVWQ